MKIAFDIDNTLWLVNNERGQSEPNANLLNVLKWFCSNGDEVYLWSSGGIEYTKEIATKLGIMDIIKIIEKPDFGGHHPDMDIAFDDVEKNLARINILVKKIVSSGVE